MKIILFGATGMIGQGVLREALLDPEVTAVLTVGRKGTGQTHEKLRELTPGDLFDLSGSEVVLTGYDACLFCLGVSATGMSAEAYRHVTYDLTLSAARTLVRLNPSMNFLYITGAGTDGRSMWARVKAETEVELLKLPFRDAYMFRPGLIRPLHGITSRTPAYRVAYAILWPIFPLLTALAPAWVTTTERLGRAMLRVAKHGAPKKVLEVRDIAALDAPRESLPA